MIEDMYNNEHECGNSPERDTLALSVSQAVQRAYRETLNMEAAKRNMSVSDLKKIVLTEPENFSYELQSAALNN